MKTLLILTFTLTISSFYSCAPAFAQKIFTSVKTGDWNDCTTWNNGACSDILGDTYPDVNDNVIIETGHTVTITQHNGERPRDYGTTSYVGGDLAFLHSGNITINGGLTTSTNVKLLLNGNVDVFGSLATVGNTADLFVTGNLFVYSTASSFSVGDDFFISSSGSVNLDIASSSADDITFDGTGAQLCGSGSLDLKNATGSADSEIKAIEGADPNTQVCDGFEITGCPSSGVTYTCKFTGSGIFLLPVELLHFYAKKGKGKIDMEWMTASEINNAFFTVEKSLDGKSWKELGIVDGMGTSYEPTNYLFSDEDPNQGLNYYRLRQNDYDGTYAYSKVINVIYTGIVISNTSLLAYPNPSKGNLSLKVTGLESEDLSLSITDVTGKIVYQNTKVEFNPYSEIELDLRNLGLKNGIFFIKLNSRYSEVSEKLFLNF
ncbi:T9SS type A sorting domain-containing protein [Flammeovirgaceae bacterium SG7u.111]|nr:T9SS type A sorting domain-containing protein [Flammeovirgaceae bacterium SG7u.132]WPO33641.1 T9SS type A sorting domain-containing protein [Flammeovirgaceae bacterium SG7u.111]